MAQHSHIPKFGSWDGDNVPYTAYFESARKDKGTGVRMNPNDPEENPEAFMFGGGEVIGNDSVKPDKSIPARNPQVEEWKPVYPKTAGRQKNVSRKSMTSEKSSSDKSSSDYSQQSNNQRVRSEQKISSSERLNTFCPPSPGPTRPRRNGYNPADNTASQRSVSVPMFGAWDEKDPKSGEGFTVIFQKVKEEKQIAAAKFPPVPQHPTNFSYSNEKKEKRAKKCSRCGCFF